MARLNRKGELWAALTRIEAIVLETAGSVLDTVLTAVAAAGATTLTTANTTNGAVATELLIGDNEARHWAKTDASTAPTGTTVTLDPATPVRHPLLIGELVKKAKIIDLGHVEGAVINHGGAGESINADTQLIELGWLPGHYNCSLEGALLGYNVENLAFVLGMLESRIRGDGTAADPRELTLDGEGVRETDDLAIRLSGVLKSGATMRVTLNACEMDPNSLNYSLGRGTKVPLPFRARSTGGLLYERWT